MNSFSDLGGAGGYITSPGNTGSPGMDSTQRKSKENKSQAILPCTIDQLINGCDSEEMIRLGSIDVAMFCVIGRVELVEEAATSSTYEITDHTGYTLTIKKWMDKSDDEEDTDNTCIKTGQYVKAVGVMKGMQQKKHFNAYHISPLKSLNELTVHLLETIHARLNAEAWNQKSNVEMDTDMGMSGFHGNMYNMNGLDKVQKAVYDVINLVPDEDGCSVDHLFQTLRSTPKDAIRKALDFLSSEGHVYPSIDNDHFKTT